MPSQGKERKAAKEALDTISGKGRRGRKGVSPQQVLARAGHLRLLLEQCWDQVGEDLVTATKEEDVIQAFGKTDEYRRRFFMPNHARLILQIVTERKFPKTRAARIGFLADSLGAEGAVSARRSRDICAAERQRIEPHQVLCREPYIECSCGYKGPASRGECPNRPAN